MIYSFRAECQVDVVTFIRKTGAIIRQLIKNPEFPDVDVEIESELDLEKLLAFTNRIMDAHVIRETLRACPLSENSLDRMYGR